MQTETWYALATLAAIALGPIIAVIITRMLDRSAEKRRRRLDVFRNLMQTRGVRLDPVHVAALNLVEIEFYKDADVRGAFQSYIQHLSAPMPVVAEQDKFFDQRSDLFMNLLSEIGSSVGFTFDKRDLERLSYVPQGWDSDQNMQRRNAEMLGQLLSGQRAMPITHFTGGQSPYPEPPKIEPAKVSEHEAQS
ncbi:hypothetical protein K3555_16835 [Leisingera sp. M527]|uniref:DUF6680 family protein n=1 Tax=Leisingera sp. M527 TaxID=2867014 RepID=UPI0021A59644|nr:DUF6680 family protein [Leisingera sp. M527]UWQ32205.1 hypothetical protein K3555_16835 [Leisingera sp. M527]